MTGAAFPAIRSPGFDLAYFVGPGLLSLALVFPIALGAWPNDTPPLAGLILIVGVDVAHVWTTLFRVYLDPIERRRRRTLYYGVPIGVLAVSLLLVAVDPALFWRALAYTAVHHFIKQQIGFVLLYRHAAGEKDTLGRRLDTAIVAAGTLTPILHWHSHPRDFAWFIPGDFLALPGWVMTVAWPLYGAVAVTWLVYRVRSRIWNPGKDLVITITCATWATGIVLLNGDLTFTVTNVLLHGVAYMALVWHVQQGIPRTEHRSRALAVTIGSRLAPFLILVVVLAYSEEWLWDALVWRDSEGLFPGSQGLMASPMIALFATATLAVPQATHYVLDGLIWRLDGSNPGLRERLLPGVSGLKPGPTGCAPGTLAPAEPSAPPTPP